MDFQHRLQSQHPSGPLANVDRIAEQLATAENGVVDAPSLSKSLRPFIALTGSVMTDGLFGSFFGGKATSDMDLQQRVKSAQEVVATAEKVSMLLGILMAHKGWSESEQLKVLKSDEFQQLDAVQHVLKHRDSTESVVDQISKYLDQQGSDDQAAAKLLSSTSPSHDSKVMGLMQLQSQWDSCHSCSVHARCFVNCHVTQGRLFAQCLSGECA